jgi:hypothetical protein
VKTILPIIAWLLFLVLAGKEFRLAHWEAALVVFAALALVPPGLELLGLPPSRWYWLAAAGFGFSYLVFPNEFAPIAALPYLLWSVWLVIQAVVNLLVFRKFRLLEWVRLAALGYWATGAVWAFCFLAGIRPLDFDPVIVGLTAAHFHVAGFVLAVVVFCLLSDACTLTNQVLGWATLAGMPLVATGITLTKLGFSPAFEQVSALGFVGLAVLVVWQQVHLPFQKNYSRSARLLWLTGSLCLLVGMSLAALYALRFSFPMSWINIPNLKIWHGTLNAVGFGWLTLQGWSLARKNARRERF